MANASGQWLDAAPQTPTPAAQPSTGGGQWLDTAPATKSEPLQPASKFDDMVTRARGKTPAQKILNSTVGKADTSLLGTIKSGTGKTLSVLDAVLGAPQRFVAGVVGGDPRNPQAGFYGHVWAGFHGALQHNEQYDGQLEDNLTKMAFGPAYANIHGNPLALAAATLAVETASDPLTYLGGAGVLSKITKIDKLENLDKGLVALKAMDLPGPMKFIVSKLEDGLSNITEPAKVVYDDEGVPLRTQKTIRGWFHPYAREDYYFNKDGYYLSTGLKRASGAHAARYAAMYRGVVERNKKALQAAKSYQEIPADVRAFHLAEAANFGTDDMRHDAEMIAQEQGLNLDGFDWSSTLKGMATQMKGQGLIEHNVLRDYVPNLKELEFHYNPEYAGEDVNKSLGELSKTRAAARAAAKGEEMKGMTRDAAGLEKGKARFTDPETGKTTWKFPDDPYKAYKVRAEMSPRVISRRWLRRELNQRMGIGGIGDYPEMLNQYPQDAKKLLPFLRDYMIKSGEIDSGQFRNYLNNPEEHLIPMVSEVTRMFSNWAPWRTMANAMTRGITNNSLPHVFNESRLAWLAGGPKPFLQGVIAGIRDGVPEEDMRKMESVGATTNSFIHLPDDPQAWYDLTAYMSHMAGFKLWSAANHGMMRRMDDGLRWAVWKNFTKKYPDKSEWEVAHMVDEAMGGYTATPSWLQLMKGFGGMFPLWHARTVPVTTYKALMQHPERAMALLRADQQLNDKDVFGLRQYGKYSVHPLGGSVYDSTKMMDSLLQVIAKQPPSYMISPSMIGAVGSTVARYGQSKYGPLATAAEGTMQYAGAAAGPLAQAGQESLNIYNSKIPLKQRLIMSVFGIYPEMAPIFQDKVSAYRAWGLSEQAAMNKAARMTLKVQALTMKSPGL